MALEQTGIQTVLKLLIRWLRKAGALQTKWPSTSKSNGSGLSPEKRGQQLQCRPWGTTQAGQSVQHLISKPVSTVWDWELELMSKYHYKTKLILWNQILSLLTASSSLQVLTSPRKGCSAPSIMGWLIAINGRSCRFQFSGPTYSKLVFSGFTHSGQN